MLGVRRSSVTVAAEALRAAGAITYTRGTVRIVDRAKLESRSCECYGIVRAAYDRLLSSGATPSPLDGVKTSEAGVSIVTAGEPPRFPGDNVLPSQEALQGFRRHVQDARRRRDDIARQLGESNELATRIDEELSVALEQLQVAEEEMRVQMESLTDMRDALEREQSAWRSRLDTLPEAFVETDQHDTIVEVNRAAEVLLGRDRLHLLGKSFPTLIVEDARPEFRQVATALRRQSTEVRWLGKFRSHDRGPVVETSVSALRIEAADGHSGTYLGARWLLRRRPADSQWKSGRSPQR